MIERDAVSRVQCSNCNEYGHFKSKCQSQPSGDLAVGGDDNFGNGGGFGGSGGANDRANFSQQESIPPAGSGESREKASSGGDAWANGNSGGNAWGDGCTNKW